MDRGPFFNRARMLRNGGSLRVTLHVSIEEQLTMFLHFVGHNAKNRVVRSRPSRKDQTSKDHPTQNVLVAVTPKKQFCYVMAGWEESTHDFAMLKSALAFPSPYPKAQSRTPISLQENARNLLKTWLVRARGQVGREEGGFTTVLVQKLEGGLTTIPNAVDPN